MFFIGGGEINTFTLSDDQKTGSVSQDISSIHLSDRDGKTYGLVSNAIYSGKFAHHSGFFEINDKVLSDFISNFENRKAGVMPAINYNHDMYNKAAGWPVRMVKKNVSLSDGAINKSGLDIEVEWTPAAAKAIRDGEYRYFSIEFSTDFVNSETRERVKNVITGGALTNKPFLKQTGVTALYENFKGGKMPTKSELLMSLKTEFELDVEALLSDSKRLKSVEEESKKLSEKLLEVEKEKEELLKKIESEKIELLLSDLVKDGKVFLSEKPMFTEFFNSVGFEKAKEHSKCLQQKLKTESKGSPNSTQSDDEEASFSERLDSRVEEIVESKKVSYEVALNEALEEIKGGM